jgi:uroporphyrin-III C-methyltransferase / precorrin-2 dehydrogenase / sirohydrochlorin ferrochelatase
MDYFPVFVELKNQSCLIIGGGEIAARKIGLLIKANANITVITKSVGHQITEITQHYPLTIIEKQFDASDVTRQFRLVISATNDNTTNQQVADAANAQGILVNVVDSPDLCSFIFPAIIDRSPIIAAVSSGGAAPVLARLLRAKIETIIPPYYGRLAQLAERFRDKVKAQFSEGNQRRIFWENCFQGAVAEQVFAGNDLKAEQLLLAALEDEQQNNTGEVYLIGAGPGAADLLTFRALRLMQQADVVVYDHLVSPDIIELARRDSEKIYVGKQRQNHTLPQESINQLLADLAKTGKRVARLKGGDPFIFGRGGEEIETLMQEGVRFQVVPGITAASGCATYAGIPLTHRDHAQSCTFVTGHLKDDSINLNWTQLAAPNQTIVVYMGLVGLEKICQSLIAHGSPKDLPAAMIQQGTTNNQRVVTGTLSTLPAKIAELAISPPTLVIIGNVVSLHEKLKWFKQL